MKFICVKALIMLMVLFRTGLADTMLVIPNYSSYYSLILVYYNWQLCQF